MRKLTIVDIAKMAGVGTTTVSRYFNGGNLKKDTKEKIKESPWKKKIEKDKSKGLGRG